MTIQYHDDKKLDTQFDIRVYDYVAQIRCPTCRTSWESEDKLTYIKCPNCGKWLKELDTQ